MKLPMNRNTILSAKGERIVPIGATPNRMHKSAPNNADAGSGIDSVTQNTATAARIPLSAAPSYFKCWEVSR